MTKFVEGKILLLLNKMQGGGVEIISYFMENL